MEHTKADYERIANEVLAVLMSPDKFKSTNETISDPNAIGLRYIAKLIRDKAPELLDDIYERYLFKGYSELEVAGKVARYVYQRADIKTSHGDENGKTVYTVAVPAIMDRNSL
ncbi:hypothetical protein [Levilactobacillus sp. N40-8-2]|uniref:hypothetical protein n=1 Tax=Levilactobacillus muriae TaxID=3238987 RepID=UPI0038B37BE0